MGEIFEAIAKNVEVIHVVLFALGVICFVIELFEPGLGIFAALGAVLMIVDIFVLADTLTQGLVLFAIAGVVMVAFAIAFLVLASKGALPGNLILKEQTDNDEGFVATANTELKEGDVGVAQTLLRPAGKAVFGDVIADVVSEGEFIEPGSNVKIIGLNGNRIVVRNDKQ